ncbi:MAG: RNA polymerase sigma factor [Sedimentisphaerales bacterium]|nr:RNA polymerase sigma factor [Sedimentisphaerales bacterium]
MLEDTLLIIRFRRGSQDALRSIYEKYRTYLLKLAVALLHDVHAGEDVVHDVFMEFARSAGRFKVKGSLKAYLRTCVVNRVRNHVRAAKVRGHMNLSTAEVVAAGDVGAEQWVILKEEALRISGALGRLPYEQREVVVLHLHGDMTFREIARSQEISIKTVQSRYRYGLDKLRALLNGEVER